MIRAHPDVPGGAAADRGSTSASTGRLGVVLVDLTALARIERSFGGRRLPDAARADRSRCWARAKAHVREDDILTRDERDADRYLLLPDRQARDQEPVRAPSTCSGLPTAWRTSSRRAWPASPCPTCASGPRVDVGYGFVLYSPLESEERQILRLIEDARTSAELRRRAARPRPARGAGGDHLQPERCGRPSSPSWRWRRATIMGYEGLSRGPRGSELEPPGDPLRAGRPLRPGRRARARLPPPGLRGLGGLRRARRACSSTPCPPPCATRASSGRGVLDYLGPAALARRR